MCFLYVLITESSKLQKNKIEYNFVYIHQILDGDNIEPPHNGNQNHLQIITSFAYVLLMIINVNFNVGY